MSRTITAMFNDRSEAEAAAAQLRTQIGAEARISDQSGASTTSSESGSSSGGGFWAELKEMFVADEDRPAYEEGVRRGHFLLSAIVPEDQADRACSLIDQAGAIDLDENQEKWRSEGWSGSTGTQASGQSAYASDRQSGFTDRASTGERSGIVEEERIPIVEEQLRVGKRETERGGARVRSYVEERPVTETVNLREEHVDVVRRPVDQPISAADIDGDLLKDRTIEMRETSEVPVVEKDARVTEEVVVQKTAEQRMEQVQDTVRNTNVEVDEDGRNDRGALFERDQQDASTGREFDSDLPNRR